MNIAALLPLIAALIATPPVKATGKVWLEGTSTVRGFRCEASNVSTEVTGADVSSIASLETGKPRFAVQIPVASLDCKNGKMNEHMGKALKADQFKEISFVPAGYKVVSRDANGAVLELSGDLTIAGTTKAVRIETQAKPEGGKIRVTGSHKILMSEYGVKPPSLMMGTLKVRDQVVVSFDLTVGE